MEYCINMRFDVICRACLCNNVTEKHSLLAENVMDMFQCCTNIQISTDDELPCQLCTTCFEKLSTLYLFRQLCSKSNETLQEYLKNIKSETCTKSLDTQPNIDITKEFENEVFNDNDLLYNSDEFTRCIETNVPQSVRENSKSENNIILPNDSKKIKFSCEICHKWFYQKERLDGHVRMHEGKKYTHCLCMVYLKPAVCEICGREFRNWNGLWQHKFLHDGIKNYSCKTCNKKFSYLTGLRIHEKIHTGIKSIVCELCGKAFKTQGELRAHMFSHTDAKPYKCPDCLKSFKTKVRFKVHILRCSGEKNFVCNICGKRSVVKQDLESHMRIHSGEKPFSCAVCHKMFTTQSNLASHKRLHTGKKPYPCDLCSLAFATANVLKNHRMIHTGERPHTCLVCKKSFTQITSLKTHSKIHNKKMTIHNK